MHRKLFLLDSLLSIRTKTHLEFVKLDRLFQYFVVQFCEFQLVVALVDNLVHQLSVQLRDPVVGVASLLLQEYHLCAQQRRGKKQTFRK